MYVLYDDFFTYHLVNIKCSGNTNNKNEKQNFTYHLVNIKCGYFHI